MNDTTRSIVVKTIIFTFVALVAIAIVYAIVQPAWLTYVVSALLLMLAVLGYSASPAGTGHVADGIVTYLIIATLLICLAASVGGGIVNRGITPNNDNSSHTMGSELP